jgi:glycosyltransferase involved in cell wall biosynthesis
MGEIPADVPVHRAFALDTHRHLSFRGRYFRWLSLPDRWVSWCLGAVPAGLLDIRRRKVDAILSTYPVATAVLIGLILHRLTGKPWVVDFRDSMTEDDYPRDPLTRRVYRWIERQAVHRGARLIFTARSAIHMYLQRYPELSPEKCVLIPNGYDEKDFSALHLPNSHGNHSSEPTRLLHMGLLYPEERDPKPFFHALARLKKEGQVSAANLRVDLRASGFEDVYSRKLRELAVEDLVHLLPPLPYHQALQDGAEADGLLLFQARNCDHQIPAKGYEYLRLGRPILALTTETGDTAATLRQGGGATIVDLADEQAIYRAVPRFLLALQRGEHPLPNRESVRQFSRRNQARQLAQCLDQVMSGEARN